MAVIIFAIADSISHYNASYTIAGRLRDDGHTIVYIADSPKRQKEVTSQGFRLEVIYHDFYNAFRSGPDAGGKKRWHAVRLFFSQLRVLARYKKELMDGRQLERLIDRLRPDLFVIDVFHVLHAAAIQRFGIKTVLLQTYLCTDKDVFVPPLTSGVIPRWSYWSFWHIEWLWLQFFVRRKAVELFHRLVMRGLDKNSLLVAVARKSGLQKSDIDTRRVFHPGIKNIPELVLAAREFDFSRTERAHRHFVGPMVELERRDVLYDRRYLEVMLDKDIEAAMGNAEKRPLVYCSLGTINATWYKRSGRFFRMLIEAFRELPSYDLFLSVGTDIKPEQFEPTPSNVHVFQLVPQLDILRRASLMITHGGINSINECILSGVPMIVYPLSNKIDQPGNAARIEYHGMGLRGDIRRETGPGILAKINKVLTDPAFRERTEAMRSVYRRYEGAREASRVIGEYLKAGTVRQGVIKKAVPIV